MGVTLSKYASGADDDGDAAGDD